MVYRGSLRDIEHVMRMAGDPEPEKALAADRARVADVVRRNRVAASPTAQEIIGGTRYVSRIASVEQRGFPADGPIVHARFFSLTDFCPRREMLDAIDRWMGRV